MQDEHSTTTAELRENIRARNAQVLVDVIGSLQNEDMRAARRTLHDMEPIPLDYWSRDDRNAAEQVCQAFNTAGFLAQHHMLDADLIVDNWKRAIVDSHRQSLDLIEERRQAEGNAELWSSFDWLAERAQRAVK